MADLKGNCKNTLGAPVHKFPGTHLYISSADTLIKLRTLGLLHRWSKNRQKDRNRVKVIAKHFEATKICLGTICLAYLEEEGGLVCYDGNHRRCALISGMSGIVVSVMWNATQKLVKEQFNCINEAVAVSELDMKEEVGSGEEDEPIKVSKEHQKVQRKVIADFVTKLIDKYPTLVSSSRACQSPHFSEPVLKEDLMMLSTEYSDIPLDKLLASLLELNKCYMRERYGFKKSTLTARALAKCNSEGLWLFCKQRTIDRAYLSRLLLER